jgi:hypothetical protein
MTKTILQDIKVFAVDSTWTLESDESGKSIRAKTISLLLTPEQTERVMLASELGKLRLALRSPNDHDEAELPEEGHRVGQIFGDSQMADLEKDSVLSMSADMQAQLPALAAVNPLTPDRPSHTVRLISGSRVQEVVMQSQADVVEPGTPNGTNPESGSAASFLWKIISSPSSATGDRSDQAQNTEPAEDAEPGAGPAPETDLEPAEPEDVRAAS